MSEVSNKQIISQNDSVRRAGTAHKKRKRYTVAHLTGLGRRGFTGVAAGAGIVLVMRWHGCRLGTTATPLAAHY